MLLICKTSLGYHLLRSHGRNRNFHLFIRQENVDLYCLRLCTVLYLVPLNNVIVFGYRTIIIDRLSFCFDRKALRPLVLGHISRRDHAVPFLQLRFELSFLAAKCFSPLCHLFTKALF